MAGNLKEVIDRLKQEKAMKDAAEKPDKIKEKKLPAKITEDEEEQYEEEFEEQEKPKFKEELKESRNISKPVPQPKVEEEKVTETVSSEINLLHNEGIFRRELLLQLSEINESLKVIALTVAKLTE
jgi:hypothetical protein